MKNIKDRRDRYSPYKKYYLKQAYGSCDEARRSSRSRSRASSGESSPSKHRDSIQRELRSRTQTKHRNGTPNLSGHAPSPPPKSLSPGKYSSREHFHSRSKNEKRYQDNNAWGQDTKLRERRPLAETKSKKHEKSPDVPSPKSKRDEKVSSPEKPNFEPSGALLEETNMKNGVVLKYTEPLDARLPVEKWRIYVFKKNDENKESSHINFES